MSRGVSSLFKYGNTIPIPVPGVFHSEFKFLGIIKNRPHYKSIYNDVYLHHKSDDLEYVADWLDEHKMLWTDYPLSYRLTTINEQDYFYDVEFHDAYKYDMNTQLVVPQGYIYNIVDKADGFSRIPDK
tara:strand:- start:246 stop:629 length:384 start_codon:yes stop_codon:yes gene_type:complete